MKRIKKTKKGMQVKSSFLTYFDGCYGFDASENVTNTFKMGVCKLEYKKKKNTLIVHLRRPGFLIGKAGITIDNLKKHLDCNIKIIEVNLYK